MRFLPRCDELEVLDRVGDVDARAVDPGLLQRRVEQLAGRADERPSGEVFLVARLLADEHDRRVERPFAEHGLGRMLVEVAAGAFARVLEQRFPRRAQVAARLDAAFRLERVLEPFLDDAARESIISSSRARAPAISG